MKNETDDAIPSYSNTPNVAPKRAQGVPLARTWSLGDIDGAARFDEVGLEFEAIALHGFAYKINV